MKSAPGMGIKSWLIFLASLPSIGLGCGISWSLPAHHFDGVSSQGYVDLWEKIEDLDLDDGSKFPLHIEFESTRETSSGILGKGFFFPFLESNVVQEDENTFKIYQPEGRFRLFWRDKNNPNILNGQGGWRAEIGSNTLTAWADCGWKLVYTKGKLTSMSTNKGGTLTWEYGEGGGVASIKEGNNTLLEVTRDLQTKEVNGLVLRKKLKIGLEWGQRPQVQVINRQKLVGAMDRSLTKLTLPDGRVKTYEFGVNKEVDPTLTLDGKRTLVWDAESKRIKGDGDWAYQITPGPQALDNAEIQRKTAAGVKEFWSRNESKGEETILEADGTKNIRTWFTSGKLAEKPRSSKEIDEKGKEIKALTYSYDENGMLLRQNMYIGGKLVEERIFKEGLIVKAVRFGDQIKTINWFQKDGGISARYTYRNSSK